MTKVVFARLRTAAPMLGLDFIRTNRARGRAGDHATKASTLDLDALIWMPPRGPASGREIDQLRTERNAISARFKSAAPEERAALGTRAKEAGARAGELEKDLGEQAGR